MGSLRVQVLVLRGSPWAPAKRCAVSASEASAAMEVSKALKLGMTMNGSAPPFLFCFAFASFLGGPCVLVHFCFLHSPGKKD